MNHVQARRARTAAWQHAEGLGMFHGNEVFHKEWQPNARRRSFLQDGRIITKSLGRSSDPRDAVANPDLPDD
jgi:hypothetical protein